MNTRPLASKLITAGEILTLVLDSGDVLHTRVLTTTPQALQLVLSDRRPARTPPPFWLPLSALQRRALKHSYGGLIHAYRVAPWASIPR